MSYDNWLGNRAKPSHREQLRAAIDQTIQQKPADLQALLNNLQEAGFTVTRRGKAITLKHTDWQKQVRLDSLGDGYTEDELIAVLSGKKIHTAQSKSHFSKKSREVNLLIDIQSKLQAGKGGGYARWASVFNIKQMAKTLNYLRDHNLLKYSDLSEQAEQVTHKYNELSSQIKSAENRMAEISVLRTHIINYSKTHDVYVAYRKAGYSKKFLANHETEILLHKAAKKAFDDLGMKRIPSVKSLQSEYAQLLEQKKRAYGEYRKAREDMKDILTAKENVDQILYERRIQIEVKSKNR